MVDLISLRPSTFYDYLYGDAKQGYVSISILDQHRLGKPHAWTDTIETVQLGTSGIGDRLAEVVGEVDAGGDARNVYFTPAPRLTPKRGHVGNTASLTSLWAEFDSPTSSPTKDPGASWHNVGEVYGAFFDPGLPESSITVSSGNGWHCYWLLDEPLPWDDRAADLLARWGTWVIERAARKGKWVDRVFDAARVLRCPATSNHKHDPPAPVEIVSMVDRRLSYHDLDDLLPPLDEASRNLWSSTHDISGLTDGVISEWITGASGWESNAEGKKRIGEAVSAIEGAKAGGRHDLMFSGLAALIQNTKGHRSQINVTQALSEMHAVFVKVKPDADESEFRNMVRYLVGQRIREDEQKAASTIDASSLKLEEIEGERSLAESLRIDWNRDPDEANEFIVPGLVARGRLITIQSRGGEGKSFVAFATAVSLATGQPVLGFPHPTGAPIDVLYLDWEMTEADVIDRKYSLGYSQAGIDLSHLNYITSPPLVVNEPEGAQMVIEMVKDTGAELVVIDTMSRAISTPENEDMGWREAMRLCWGPLKRAGVTILRLDHLGKDITRGGRGHSTKRDEADLIWNMVSAGVDEGRSLRFTIDKARISIPAISVAVAWRVDEFGMVNFVADPADPIFGAPNERVNRLIALIDDADLPLDWGRPRVRDFLTDNDPGFRARNTELGEAIRYRRDRGQGSGTAFSTASENEKGQGSGTVGDSSPAPRESPTISRETVVPEDLGQVGDSGSHAVVPQSSRSLDRGLGTAQTQGPFLCHECGEMSVVISSFEPFDLICGTIGCEAPPIPIQNNPYQIEVKDEPSATAAEPDRPPPPFRA